MIISLKKSGHLCLIFAQFWQLNRNPNGSCTFSANKYSDLGARLAAHFEGKSVLFLNAKYASLCFLSHDESHIHLIHV